MKKGEINLFTHIISCKMFWKLAGEWIYCKSRPQALKRYRLRNEMLGLCYNWSNETKDFLHRLVGDDFKLFSKGGHTKSANLKTAKFSCVPVRKWQIGNFFRINLRIANPETNLSPRWNNTSFKHFSPFLCWQNNLKCGCMFSLLYFVQIWIRWF